LEIKIRAILRDRREQLAKTLFNLEISAPMTLFSGEVLADDGSGMLPLGTVRSNHGLPISSFKASVRLDGSMKLVTLVESIVLDYLAQGQEPAKYPNKDPIFSIVCCGKPSKCEGTCFAAKECLGIGKLVRIPLRSYSQDGKGIHDLS
jgi:hypothetical protein